MRLANSLACIPGQWITCSRITWAFSRDVSKASYMLIQH